jgi:hypothetical protein
MSIEQIDVVDFVSIDKNSGDAWLTISDHLTWDRNEGEHLLLLQNKLNTYLRFIESGEVLKKFSETEGRRMVINLVGQFPLSERASLFVEKASAAVSGAGFKLQFKLFRSDS